MRAGRPRRPIGPMPARGTDRVERAATRLLAVLVLAVAVAGTVVGLRVAAAGHDRAQATQGLYHQVDAELLVAVPGPMADATNQYPTPVRWTALDGRAHTGQVWVSGPADAGSTTPLWLDRAGIPTAPPPGPVEIVAGGVFTGFAVLVLGAALLVGGRLLVRRWTTRRNAAAWARGWAAVEPLWSGRRS